MGIISGLNFLRIYRTEKQKYYFDIDKQIKNGTEIKINDVWEFEKDYFKLKTNKSETKTHWEKFKGFRGIEKTIFLDLKATSSICYRLSYKEIDTDNYKKVITLLEQKLIKTRC